MAQEIRLYSVTVPAGTAQASPQVTALTMPPRTVDAIEILVPPGPRGEVGFALGGGGVAVIPVQPNTWIVTDNEVVNWPLSDYIDSGGWQLFAYNTGNYAHTLTVRFLLSLTTATASTALQPISASDLGAVPQAPEIPVPTLPSLPSPPTLPQVPPPPTITFPAPPSIPTLPAPPAPPGPPGPAEELTMTPEVQAAFTDLSNKLGDLQYFLDPGTGATSQGEDTLRIRSVDNNVAQLIALTQSVATALTALSNRVDAIARQVGAQSST